MPQFAEVLYNLTGFYVAEYQGNNAWGTPSFFEYGQKVSFEFEVDNDSIKAYGMTVELLSVVIAAKLTLSQASLDFASAAIISGLGSSESGSTPNQNATMDYLMGGGGLPYFGAIGSFAGLGVSNALIGMPKMKLDNYPPFEMDQNKFRIGEFEATAITPSTAIRKAVRVRRFETASALPSTANAFAAFFNGMFD